MTLPVSTEPDRPARWPESWLPIALLAMAVLYYFHIVTMGGTFLAPSMHGMIFNSMALNLLQGRFDVDAAAVGGEAFIRDGRTYAYFGIIPALLRWPLVPFVDLAAVPVEGPYRLAAMTIAAAGVTWFVRSMTARMPPSADLPGLVLLVAVLFSGPAVMVGARPAVFNEAALWSWAEAACFLAVLAPILDAARPPPSAGRLAALAALAGCAVLTRPTMGLGLLAALAALMVVVALRHEPSRPLRCLLRAAASWRMIAPTLVVLAFLIVAAAINQARWGNPATFADLTLQTQMIALFPDRMDRLEAYGLFNLRRIGLGLIYYFAPIWIIARDGIFLFHDDIVRLFDAFELPPSSFFLSDPLTMAFAAVGFVAMARGRVPGIGRAPALAAMAGLSVPPLLMLTAWYMAFRYRVEFMPLLLLAAGCGAMRVGTWMTTATVPARRAATGAMMALLGMQIAAAMFFAMLYLASPWGPSGSYAAEGLGSLYRRTFTPP